MNSAGTTVYISCSNGTVMAQDPTGTTTYSSWNGSSSGTAFSNPYGLAISPLNGNLYVADEGDGRIIEFDGNGNYVAQLGGSIGALPGQFSGPFGVAVDGSGNVYVTDTFNYRVQKFAPF